MKVLVTGASGFVGKKFVEYNKEKFAIETVSLRNEDWRQQNFSHIDVVVHLAGKAHEMTPIEDRIYFDINYELTKLFYKKVVNDGVKHFIYISSTKVYGDGSYEYLDENSSCNPTDAYGKSKLQAEQFLLLQQNAIVSIIRPPLIYGEGVKGNLFKLIQLCNSNKPLPFAKIENKRSMVYVGNLIELINEVILQNKPGVFVAGDENPLSTTTLVTLIRKSLHRNNNLFSIPIYLRNLLKRFKPEMYVRLFGSFYVSNKKTNESLNITAKYKCEDGINQMVKAYLNKQ